MLPPRPGPTPLPSPEPTPVPVPLPIPLPVPGPEEGVVLLDRGSPYGSTRASGATNNGSALTVAATGNAGFFTTGGLGSGGKICGTSKDAWGNLPADAGVASCRPPPPPPPGFSCLGLLPPPEPLLKPAVPGSGVGCSCGISIIWSTTSWFSAI